MTHVDEYILNLEWDYFSTPRRFRVLETGYLHPKIDHVTVERDELSLKVEATGPDPDLQAGGSQVPAGTLLSALSVPPVKIQASSGALGELRGVFPGGMNVSFAPTPGIRQRTTAFEADIVLRDSPVAHVTEWLANVPNDYLWLGVTERHFTERYQRSRFSDDKPPPPTLEISPSSQKGSSRDHTRLHIANDPATTLLFGTVPKDFAPEQLRAGFLSYAAENGIPDDNRREQIRSALSFLLGRQFAYLGYTTFDADWKIVRVVARRGHIAGDQSAIRRAAMPPSPLSAKPGEPWLEPDFLEGMLQGFLSCVDELGLAYILWLVWYAHASPIETAPAQFGAAIEALGRSFLESRASSKTTLLPSNDWAKLLVALRKSLDAESSGLDDSCARDLAILRNKLSGLNQRPLGSQMEELFSILRLPVSECERRALRERNRPAHGGAYSPEEYPELIGHVRTLYTLFNRLLLKSLGGTAYVDYAATGHPSRPIDKTL